MALLGKNNIGTATVSVCVCICVSTRIRKMIKEGYPGKLIGLIRSGDLLMYSRDTQKPFIIISFTVIISYFALIEHSQMADKLVPNMILHQFARPSLSEVTRTQEK